MQAERPGASRCSAEGTAEHLEASSVCQIFGLPESGRLRRPGFVYNALRVLANFRENGAKYTLKKAVGVLGRFAAVRTGHKPGARRTPVRDDEILGLAPGDWVQVKSLEEIRATLDGAGKNRGLVFTPAMRQYCGGTFRVFKRLELMFDEVTHEQRRTKNTVLLEGIVCHGEGIGCDRSCFHYWREAWLRPVEAPPATARFAQNLQERSSQLVQLGGTNGSSPRCVSQPHEY